MATNELLIASKKIQTWIHTHPRKATIVQSVIDEFDNAITAFESQAKEPSDEDIIDAAQKYAEKCITGNYTTSALGYQQGAKDARDGKIKSNQIKG